MLGAKRKMSNTYTVNGMEDIEGAMKSVAIWRYAIDLMEYGKKEEDLDYYASCLCKFYSMKKEKAKKVLLNQIKELENEVGEKKDG